jgi:hypothetical protein
MAAIDGTGTVVTDLIAKLHDETLKTILTDAIRDAFVTVTTTERDALAGDDLFAGRCVYNETTNKLNFYNGSAWEAVTSA